MGHFSFSFFMHYRQQPVVWVCAALTAAHEPPLCGVAITRANRCAMRAASILNCMALIGHWLCERMAFRRGNVNRRRVAVVRVES